MTNHKPKKDRHTPTEVKRWETVNRIRRIDLPIGQHCLISVTPVGLDEVCKGARVSVKCTLFLPAKSDPNYNKTIISKEISFENTIQLLEFNLYLTWGEQSAMPDYRSISRTKSGKNWQEAFSNAESYLKSEVGKLRDALQARHDALHSEGYEMLVASRLMGDTLPSIEPMDFSSWAGIAPSEPSDDDIDDPFVDA